MSFDPILSVDNLTFDYVGGSRKVKAVGGISFDLSKGECLGLIGESGSGKSASALALTRLVSEPPGMYLGGKVVYGRRNLLQLDESELLSVRGSKIAYVFQNPETTLSPYHCVGDQIRSVLHKHKNLKRGEAESEVIRLMELVGIKAPAKKYFNYPSELSGGMCQRILISMALSCSPEILILDEPTTGLDVTVQSRILRLLKELREKENLTMLFISHDAGVVKNMCDRVAIMYCGKIVEIGKTEVVLSNPIHPYSRGLVEAVPSVKGNLIPLVPIKGNAPDPGKEIRGCSFYDRCSLSMDMCRETFPPLQKRGEDISVACFREAR